MDQLHGETAAPAGGAKPCPFCYRIVMRMRLIAVLPLLLLLLLAPCAGIAQGITRAELWGRATGPSPGPTRIIGAHALGCIAGAMALPPEGPGWQVVRLSRNRYWGHPSLVAFVRDFSGRARAAGFADLWIGDLSQPRGGPMPYGHASHQIGLDVDIWLDLSRKPAMSREQRETITVASLVLPDERDVDPARFTAGHARLIRMAAESPNVERVLVNHGIKRALCRTHRGEAWLRRVRPWRGHDQHMHIRLRCPPDSPDCRDQAPPPNGDGCDASLDWWLTPEARRPPTGPSGPPPQLPPACAGVLAAP